jgi:hypothetical protein
MTKLEVQEWLTADDAYHFLISLRNKLSDMEDTVATLIDYLVEEIYYKDDIQANLDELLKSVRNSWAITDSLITTLADYRKEI